MKYTKTQSTIVIRHPKGGGYAHTVYINVFDIAA